MTPQGDQSIAKFMAARDRLLPVGTGPFVLAVLKNMHVLKAYGSRVRSKPRVPAKTEDRAFLSIKETADRWRCSRGTVYNRLRAAGATWIDFGKRGKRSKKAIPMSVVLEIERRYSRKAN